MEQGRDAVHLRRKAIVGTLKLLIVGVAAVSLTACAGASMNASELGKTRATKLGPVLVDGSGNTLYTYDPDSPGTSKCTGTCAIVWPPAEAEMGATPSDGFTIITRPGGTHQWAYKGKPLYGYMFDSGPGAVSGDGEDGVWHVAKP